MFLSQKQIDLLREIAGGKIRWIPGIPVGDTHEAEKIDEFQNLVLELEGLEKAGLINIDKKMVNQAHSVPPNKKYDGIRIYHPTEAQLSKITPLLG